MGSLLWLLALAVAAYVVSEVTATVLRAPRSLYVAVLSLVAAVLTIGYVAWAGLDPARLLATHWGWGLLAAPLSGGFLIVGMTRLPVTRRYAGRSLARAALWEGVVYGIAEGVLLSALPVLITWQMVYGLGWSGVAGTVALWVFPIITSVGVIIVHHLGYPEYRNRMLLPISADCGLLSLGYLLTGSPIAPTLGHILGHTSFLLHGAELPPHSAEDIAARPAIVADAGQVRGRGV